MRRDNRTEKTTKKKRRRKKRYFLRLCIFIIICTGAYITLHVEYFNIDGIAVGGNKDISDEEILKLSELEAGENIFDIHPWFAERRIKKNLYIEDVDVKRRLPDKVEIIVTERAGKAQFLSDKKYIVTDNEGTVLEISDKARRVTLITGITVEDARLKKTIKIKENGDYENMMSIVKSAEEGDIYFKKLSIEESKVTAYVYDELICKGRYDNFIKAINNESLKAVLFDLYQKGKEKGTINIGSNNYCSFSP